MFIDKSMTRNVITIRPEATLLDARAKMDENHIRHLPVVKQDNTVIGIITDRDLRSALPSVFSTYREDAKETERISELKVGDVMTKNPVTISPKNTLEDAIMMMHKMHKGAFPVVDNDGKHVGTMKVTRAEIMRFADVPDEFALAEAEGDIQREM